MVNFNFLNEVSDALIPGLNAAKTANKTFKSEKFEDAYQETKTINEETKTINEQIPFIVKYGSIFNILIFVLAAYLSWTCNSNCYKNMNIVEKVIRAFFAGFFGIIYLIIYVISWSADCNKCSENVINPAAILPSQNIYF